MLESLHALSCLIYLLESKEIGKVFPVAQTSTVAQAVKCLLTTWETWVWPLGREDPLEKEMATQSNTLAWKIP